MKNIKHKICLMLVALCGAFTGAADIVHSPYAAFVANYNGETFSNGPQVDANGGIWSYGCRTNAANSAFYSFSASKFKRASSELGGMNNQVDSHFIPYIVINPTSSDVSDSGASWRKITQGNEFVVQPGNANKAANMSNCGLPVIKFTAPRAGRYSVSAVCETLANSSGDDGVTSFHLLVNGSVVEERDLAHVSGGGTTHTFAKSGILLGFGDTIELVVGPGMTPLRGNSINYSSDSSSVKIEIVEAEDFYSLGDDMAANILTGNSDNPFLDGRWTAGKFVRVAENPYPKNGAITSLLWGFSRDTYFVGYNEDGSTTKTAVYCCVNTNDQSRTALSQSIDPHEVLVVPHASRNADFRFVTPEDGTWRITAHVRNLQNSANASGCGVRALLLAGGACLADETLATPGTKVAREIEVVTSRLKSGAFIDLVIDSRGVGDYDPTGVKLFVEKVDDAECPYADGGVAFNTEMAKKEGATNPFTDAQGITWQIGKSSGPQGAFSLLSYYLERVPSYLTGWTVSSGTVLPRVQANYNATNIVGVSSIMTDRYMLYGNEFWLHPNGTTHGVMRFVAPSTGVYRVSASFRDIIDRDMDKAGVNCYVCANGQVATRGFACATWNGSAYTTNRVAFLAADSLYLAAGEPIDFSVGTTRGADSDATAVSCRVAPDGGAEDGFVNVDFTSGAAAAFSGRGRFGWADPRWNALRIGAGARASTRSGLRDAGNMHTVVSVVVSNATGLAVSTAAADCSLLESGVASASPSDVSFFSIGGLTPGGTYRLCLYGGTQGSGDARAVFAVGGAERTAQQHWFRAGVPEVATFEATADGNGEISGTFRSDSESSVAFFGLQVAGSFTLAPPPGLFIIFR